jgi:hypothetical protein
MRVTLLLVCVWLLTGCRYIISEPYPAFTYGTVAPEKLPRPVMRAFAAAHPDRLIERVETESFKGSVQEYRIWFRSEQGRSDSLIFDPEGQPVVAPARFIPEAGPATNEPPGANSRHVSRGWFGSSEMAAVAQAEC